jgi:cell division protein FtsL
MNAAARLLHQGTLSRGWAASVFWERFQFLLFIVVLALLISALGLVYVTNSVRTLHAEFQQLQTERNQLHVQWGQLLLEKTSLIQQARIERVAEQRLGMIVPEGKAVVVIDSK